MEMSATSRDTGTDAGRGEADYAHRHLCWDRSGGSSIPYWHLALFRFRYVLQLLQAQSAALPNRPRLERCQVTDPPQV
jgi:hypothetical protein